MIGCGAIAQLAHLPYVQELGDRFTIAALSDVVPGTLDAVGDKYGVPPHARFGDYRALCASDLVDAVMVCTSGSHVPASIAALEGGKHVIVEKPVTWVLAEAEQLVEVAREARRRSGAVTLMAYMKLFYPGFQYGQRIVRERRNEIKYVDARHIHAHNPLYELHHTLLKGEVPEHLRAARAAAGGLVGTARSRSRPAKRKVLAGMGSPPMTSTVFARSWPAGGDPRVRAHQGGRPALFRYPGGVLVNYAWIEIGPARGFRQEFARYAIDLHLSLRFPHPYSSPPHHRDREHHGARARRDRRSPLRRHPPYPQESAPARREDRHLALRGCL